MGEKPFTEINVNPQSRGFVESSGQAELAIDAGSLALLEVAVRDSIEGQPQFIEQRRRKEVRLAQGGVLRAARKLRP